MAFRKSIRFRRARGIGGSTIFFTSIFAPLAGFIFPTDVL